MGGRQVTRQNAPVGGGLGARHLRSPQQLTFRRKKAIPQRSGLRPPPRPLDRPSSARSPPPRAASQESLEIHRRRSWGDRPKPVELARFPCRLRPAMNALNRSAKNGHGCLHRRHVPHARCLLADARRRAFVAAPALSDRRAACRTGLTRDLRSREPVVVDRFGSAAVLSAPKSAAPRSANPALSVNRLHAVDATEEAAGRDRQFMRTDAKPRTPLGAIVAAVWPRRFRVPLVRPCVPPRSTRCGFDFGDPSWCPAWTHLLTVPDTTRASLQQATPRSPQLPASAGFGVLVSSLPSVLSPRHGD